MPRVWARAAGVFYLITIAMGVFAELFVRGRLVVRNDAAATAANIVAHESLYRLGLAADLVMLVAYVVVTVLFYMLFKPVSRVISLLAACFSMVGIAVLAVNCLNHVAPLLLREESPTFALIALKLHSRGYGISSVFFGVYCLLIGWLVFRSGFLPRFIGVLMAIGGLGYLTSSFTSILSPALASRMPDLGILGGIAELALTLWLIVMSVKTTNEAQA